MFSFFAPQLEPARDVPDVQRFRTLNWESQVTSCMLTDFLWEEVRCLEKFVADFLLLVVERYSLLRAYNLRIVTNNLLASSHGGCLKMWLETVSEDLSDASV